MAVMICAIAQAASGHPLFMTFIEHRNFLTVGAKNIDIRVELTFFEVRSQIERRRMDGDGDGTITPTEVAAYLNAITEQVDAGVILRIDGREVEVYPMYGPALDLLGVDRIAPVHHRLILTYFARTPEWLKTDSRIKLTDGLWPGVSAVPHFVAEGQDEILLEAKESRLDNPAPPLTFVARVRKGPDDGPAGESRSEVEQPGHTCNAANDPHKTEAAGPADPDKPLPVRALLVETNVPLWSFMAAGLIVWVFALLIVAAVAIRYRRKPPHTGA